MILIVCLDDRLGMAFNCRRQSRDSALIADICADAKGAPVWMDSRSALLFKDFEADILCCDDFGAKAGTGEYCFLEFSAPCSLEGKAEKIIIYRWNRRYQADLCFDIDLDAWKLDSVSEFTGTSHDKITKEVYSRE